MSTSQLCVVTGGGGFIGSHLVEALVLSGWRVRVLDKQCFGNPNLAGPDGRCEFIKGDFGDTSVVAPALCGASTLFHYASTTTPATAYGRAEFDVQTNLIGTLRLLDAAVRAGVSRVIFSSSGGTVYGPTSEIPITELHPCAPICSHGIIKRAIESYLESLGRSGDIMHTILRYSNPYGPGQRPDRQQGAVAVFTGRILCGESIDLWASPDTVRDYIYISDLIAATMAAAGTEKSINRTLNVGSGEGVSLRELISLIEAASGRRAEVTLRALRPIDVPVNVLATGLAEQILQWTPKVTLREGVLSSVRWVERYLEQTARGLQQQGLVRGARD